MKQPEADPQSGLKQETTPQKAGEKLLGATPGVGLQRGAGTKAGSKQGQPRTLLAAPKAGPK